MTRYYCSTCDTVSKTFKTKEAAEQHIRARHPKKGGEARERHPESNDSMADLFIEGELNRAMGVRNPDWLEDMLP